jgi:hypothetical protein
LHIPALSLLLALINLAWAGPDQTTDAQAFDRFFSAGYDYCDAMMVGAYWGKDTYEAKLRMGRKVDSAGKDAVDALVKSALEQARSRGTPTCSIYDAGYTYQDAEALAALWGTSVENVKTSMELKINGGDEVILREELARARAAGHGGSSNPLGMSSQDEAAAFSRYADSRYAYCDARVLGTYWGGDAYTGKLLIGRKLIDGIRDSLQLSLKEARTQAISRGETCDFYETNYTYEDAVALSTAWKMSLADTKAKVGHLKMHSDLSGVNEVLGRGKKASEKKGKKQGKAKKK